MGYLTNLAGAILGRTTNPTAEARSIEDPATDPWDAIRDLDSMDTTAGERVSPKRALSIPAIYQAVSSISGDVAKIPLAVYRRRPDGGRETARNHHGFRYVNLSGMANPETNAYKFWRRLMSGALLWNNGYAWIDRNGRGEVLGLYNLLPDRTTPVRIAGQRYYMTEVAGRKEYLPDAASWAAGRSRSQRSAPRSMASPASHSSNSFAIPSALHSLSANSAPSFSRTT